MKNSLSKIGIKTLSSSIIVPMSSLTEDDLIYINNFDNFNGLMIYSTKLVYIIFTEQDCSIKCLNFHFRFVAINADRKQSQQHTIQVQLCTGCRGNGRCSTTVRPDPRENAFFKYSACVCDPGYTGL